jgi:alkylhydroperoxidase/carboxymuconolactone decarboxylase family protein YurZ
MKTIITCGYPYSGYDIVGQFLYQSGVVTANISRNEALSPKAIEDKIFNMYELDKYNITTQAQLGLVCQEFAKNLFLENISEKLWGWDSENSIWLLNFWRKFDPQIRFVLVYASTEFIIANMLQKQTPSYALETILQRVNVYNTEIIRFYNQYPNNCLLVNSQAISQNPQYFIQTISKQFKLNLNIKNIKFHSTTPSAILIHLAQDLLAEIAGDGVDDKENIIPIMEGMSLSINYALDKNLISEADILYQELESIANIPYMEEKLNIQEKIAAFKEYNTLIVTLNEARKKVIELDKKAHILSDNSRQKENKINELKDKIKKITAKYELNLLKQQSDNKQNIEQENELLLLQLHQVQEELETYFSKYKEKEKEKNTIVTQNSNLKNQLYATEKDRNTFREKASKLIIIEKELEGLKTKNRQLITISQERDTLKVKAKKTDNQLILIEKEVQKLTARNSELGTIEKERNALKEKTKKLAIIEKELQKLKVQNNQLTEIEKERNTLQEKAKKLILIEQEVQVLRKKENQLLSATKEIDNLKKKADKLVNSADILGLNIDLTKETFTGNNWYDIESDGRWSGPELTSTIIIPKLVQGIYEITLNVVDAMLPEITQQLNITLNQIELLEPTRKKKGFLFKKQKKSTDYPISVKRLFNTQDLNTKEPWVLSITASSVISPSDIGGDKEDLRKLSIRVASVIIKNT